MLSVFLFESFGSCLNPPELLLFSDLLSSLSSLFELLGLSDSLSPLSKSLAELFFSLGEFGSLLSLSL